MRQIMEMNRNWLFGGKYMRGAEKLFFAHMPNSPFANWRKPPQALMMLAL